MNKEYEVRGGIVQTPERGNIEIPPEKTARKDSWTACGTIET